MPSQLLRPALPKTVEVATDSIVRFGDAVSDIFIDAELKKQGDVCVICFEGIVDHLKLHRSVLTAIDGIIPKPPSGQDPNGAASAVQQGGAAGAPEPAPQLHHGTAKRGRDSMEQLQGPCAKKPRV